MYKFINTFLPTQYMSPHTLTRSTRRTKEETVTNLLRIWTLILLLPEPIVLLATHSKVPAASVGTFSHSNVKVPPDSLLVVLVTVMESLLLLTGSPLCIHSNKGRGIASKLHSKVKVLSTSNAAVSLLVKTSGISKCERREPDS